MSCRETTPRTTHFVRGSGPHSLVTWIETRISTVIAFVGEFAVRDSGQVYAGTLRYPPLGVVPEPQTTPDAHVTRSFTSGWALIIAWRLERCGSSVYVQKKWSSTRASGAWILAEAGSVLDVFADTRRCGVAVSTAVMLYAN